MKPSWETRWQLARRFWPLESGRRARVGAAAGARLLRRRRAPLSLADPERGAQTTFPCALALGFAPAERRGWDSEPAPLHRSLLPSAPMVLWRLGMPAAPSSFAPATTQVCVLPCPWEAPGAGLWQSLRGPRIRHPRRKPISALRAWLVVGSMVASVGSPRPLWMTIFAETRVPENAALVLRVQEPC